MFIAQGQTKIGGIVIDEQGEPVSFANVFFKNSTEGTITNDDGRFYIESENEYPTVIISFIGYTDYELQLDSKVAYDLKITMVEAAEQLNEVVLIAGKQSKKNNPAVDILRKIWSKKRQNGVRQFDQYAFDKYEKVEFDLNTIDSALIKSKVFKGLEFVFQELLFALSSALHACFFFQHIPSQCLQSWICNTLASHCRMKCSSNY